MVYLSIPVIYMYHLSLCVWYQLQVEGGKVGREGEGKPGRTKQFKKTPQIAKEAKGGGASTMKRGRGRPRLTEEEKQRRKELRELGLMKRSHRRTKEGESGG